jgi:hypothetical protein
VVAVRGVGLGRAARRANAWVSHRSEDGRFEAASRADFRAAPFLGGEAVPSGRWPESATKLGDENPIYRMRIFRAGARLDQAVAVAGETRGADASVRRFLDSFEIPRDRKGSERGRFPAPRSAPSGRLGGQPAFLSAPPRLWPSCW